MKPVILAGVCGLALISLTGAECMVLTDGLLLPYGDNETACRTVSVGGEIAAAVAFRGRVTKLTWQSAESSLDLSGSPQTLVLIATNATDGYASGDTNGRFELRLRHSEALAPGQYRDAPLLAEQQPTNVDVRISSSPGVNAISLQNGTGQMTVTQFRVTGDRLTFRGTFSVQMLDLNTGRTERVCGDTFFDGLLAITEAPQ